MACKRHLLLCETNPILVNFLDVSFYFILNFQLDFVDSGHDFVGLSTHVVVLKVRDVEFVMCFQIQRIF